MSFTSAPITELNFEAPKLKSLRRIKPVEGDSPIGELAKHFRERDAACWIDFAQSKDTEGKIVFVVRVARR